MSEENIDKLEIKIDSVVVYQSGAQIKEIGKINLSIGQQSIIIQDRFSLVIACDTWSS